MSTRNYSVALVAGTENRLGRGKTFFIRSASSPLDVSLVMADRKDQIAFTGVQAGFKLNPWRDDRYFEFLTLLSSVNQTVEIVVGDEDVDQIGNISATFANPSGLASSTATVGVAAAAFIAANSNRKRLTVQSSSANTASIYLGGSTVTTANGIELLPGATTELNNTAALYAIAGAAAQTLRLLEET